jgi:putative methanogen marker protein 4
VAAVIDLDGLLGVGCGSDARVGIGAWGDRLSKTVDALHARGCKARLVGFDDPGTLCEALRNGDIDAGVRGTLSSAVVLGDIKASYGVGDIMRTAVLASSDGKPFLLTPVGIDEGRTKAERLELARATVEYFSPVGWRPTIGVLSNGRPEDGHRGEGICRSMSDGEEIAFALSEDGLEAKHHHILVEKAVRESDLIVAPDGVAGNLMFRTLHFIGSGRAYGAPVLNLPTVFVDTSRAKVDFVEPVLLAAGLVEHGCGAGQRA